MTIINSALEHKAILIPAIGWLISEIMPFLPTRANGILHAIAQMLGIAEK